MKVNMGFIQAELIPKTRDGKTPNCAACDQPSYFRFRNSAVKNFYWRHCAKHMSELEREAVKAVVMVEGDLAI